MSKVQRGALRWVAGLMLIFLLYKGCSSPRPNGTVPTTKEAPTTTEQEAPDGVTSPSSQDTGDLADAEASATEPLPGALVNRVRGFERALYTLNVSDTTATRTSRVQPFVTAQAMSDIDLSVDRTSRADRARITKKIVQSARAGTISGSTRGANYEVLAPVTISLTRKGKVVSRSKALDSSVWSYQNGQWSLISFSSR